MRYFSFFLIILQLCSLAYSSDCKKLINGHFSWHDLDSIVGFKGDRAIGKLIDIDPARISNKAHKEMSALKKAGGLGKFKEVIYLKRGNKEVWTRDEVIEVTKAPDKEPYLGIAFEEIFKKLRKSNTPIVIDPHISYKVAAYMYSNKPYSKDASSILFVGSSKSNLVLRHELKHVLDFNLETANFLDKVPNMPKSIHKIVEKIKKNQKINWFERKRVDAARQIPRDIAEVRASEGSLKWILNKKGFEEIVLNKKFYNEITLYFTEILNSSFRNLQLFYHSAWANPLDPGNILITIKVAGIGLIVYEVIGKDIIFLYHVYTSDS